MSFSQQTVNKLNAQLNKAFKGKFKSSNVSNEIEESIATILPVEIVPVIENEIVSNVDIKEVEKSEIIEDETTATLVYAENEEEEK